MDDTDFVVDVVPQSGYPVFRSTDGYFSATAVGFRRIDPNGFAAVTDRKSFQVIRLRIEDIATIREIFRAVASAVSLRGDRVNEENQDILRLEKLRIRFSEALEILAIGRDQLNSLIRQKVFSVQRDSRARNSPRFLLWEELRAYAVGNAKGDGTRGKIAVAELRERLGTAEACDSGGATGRPGRKGRRRGSK